MDCPDWTGETLGPMQMELIRVAATTERMTVQALSSHPGHNIVVVAVQGKAGRIRFNPNAESFVEAGDSVTVIGTPEDVDFVSTLIG